MREYIFYNKEQKNRFLETIDKKQYSELHWERLFEKTGEREQHYKKDLCNFTKQQAIEVLKWFGSSSYKTLNVLKLDLEKYVGWCLINTLVVDNQNHFSELDDKVINSCVDSSKMKQMIIPKDKFITFINSLDNYIDKYIYMALYEGISGLQLIDLLNIKMEDIDESNMTISLSSGKVIPVSKQFINICKLADKEEFRVTKDGRKCYLESSSTIYKRRPNTTEDSHRVIQRLIRTSTIDGYSLTTKSIMNSGLINMINELAKENNCNGEDVIYNEDLFKEIHNKYNLDPYLRKRFVLEYSDFLQ